MKEKNQNNLLQTVHAPSLHAAEPYTAPDIDVIDIELENCFAESPGGTAPDFTPGDDWN